MRKIHNFLAVLISIVGLVAIPAGRASAATTNNLIRTQDFTETPRPGATTCQHRYVTLPRLASGHYYAWAETFDGIDDGNWTSYDNSFYGSFYWTVCVQGVRNPYYNYKIWSLITQNTTTCRTNGNCRTLALPAHLFKLEQSGSYYWGSQFWSTLHI